MSRAIPSARALGGHGPASVADTAARGHYRITVENEADFSVRRLCPLRHNYCDHPLLRLDRLAALAHELMPTRQCRFIVPGMTETSKFDHRSRPVDGRGIDETFERIEEPGSWIALYNIQTNPLYQAFVWEVLRSAGVLLRRERPYEARGFLFISAPPSLTPFHIDRENNFWLQIRGHKTLNLWDNTDRVAVAARDVEDFIVTQSLEHVGLTDAARPRVHAFECGPGDGAYFPCTTPHMTRSDRSWVKPGDAISMSFGVVFYTPDTRRRAYAFAANRLLRRAGIEPRMPGRSRWLDRAKRPLGMAQMAARRMRGFPLPHGF
ncbi:cupin [Lysobacter maris]|uniref:Cupin n=1 Tax=Marilutibacter maris TaxID=1605891 RepID=A0A508ADW2_9GAMM|nr:cupin [Lysobacter maris]KAB8174832.1 cupin [Lysobacter maris]